MNYQTQADLGGRTGFGAVRPEPEGELFHADWEPRALALVLAMGATGSWNIDASRAVRETLPHYLQLSYYRIWLAALERLMIERGQLFEDEIAQGRMLHAPAPVKRVLHAADVAAVLARGSPTERPAAAPARFAIGQAVRMRTGRVDHHTRLPGYVQGRRGTVERLHGAHVFADSNAQGAGEAPQWLYTVVFEEAELWGSQAQQLSVSVDAWESYLEAAE
ncbi:nitrile hydratase subunit beta [Variovorax sp.]|uniref:nitrile hydratase subunit beta n=1 Tax=Variovorax sp. TaxID=1871043 RepID=UPI001382920D|nr:nitrile hydratase subunit beta [Variovorax sp.]KAF1067695.1 MAG: Low-molecular weight cobalt-containing nitrile hydratase subunit beta [Variovorax sp.]